MKTRTKYALGILALVAFLALAFPFLRLFAIAGYEAVQERRNRLPFEPTTWEKGKEADIRIRMLPDLLRRHRLEGKTRAEVVDLLGEPEDPRSPVGQALQSLIPGYSSKKSDMVYPLGKILGRFSIDSRLLVLELNEKQVVIAHRVFKEKWPNSVRFHARDKRERSQSKP